MLSTLTFSDPAYGLKIRGATRNRDGSLSGSISFVDEKDVTVNGSTIRKSMRVILQPQVTTDFSVAEIQAAIKAIYDFSQTAGFLDRFLQGES